MSKSIWLSQKKATPKPRGGLTASLSNAADLHSSSEDSAKSDTLLTPPPPPQSPICPPDCFPCLYPNDPRVADFPPSVFAEAETGGVAIKGKKSSAGEAWSLSLSLGRSFGMGMSLGGATPGSFGGGGPGAGGSQSGTPVVADYAENPFSRRKSEYIPSPAASLENKALWQSWGSPSVRANYFDEVGSYGSLPRALAPEARARLAQETPASPARSMLKTMPLDRVKARTLEGRKLRRRMLKGSVIVFISAGYSGKRFIYEKAKELGVRSVIFDGPDSWSRLLEEDGVIEKFIPFDWSDNETVFQRCLAEFSRVQQEVGPIDGVCSFWEVAQPLVARLAEHLGLPGNSPGAVDAAREKQTTRRLMAEGGLPTPKNALIRGPGDVTAAARGVGFPAVIKPISGAASLGVVRVDDLEMLERTYRRVVREVGALSLNEAGDFVQGDVTEGDGAEEKVASTLNAAGGVTVAQTFLMEQYLDGPEVDIDVFFSDGECVYGSITDNWPTIEPYFNETGSNCPCVLPLSQQRELCELAVKSVKCLGFRMGAFHVEGKYTSHGPHIIEVNARMGGGPVCNINKTVWGVDLVEEQLLACCGIPSQPLIAPRPLKEIAEYSVNAKETGILLNNEYLKVRFGLGLELVLGLALGLGLGLVACLGVCVGVRARFRACLGVRGRVRARVRACLGVRVRVKAWVRGCLGICVRIRPRVRARFRAWLGFALGLALGLGLVLGLGLGLEFSGRV